MDGATNSAQVVDMRNWFKDSEKNVMWVLILVALFAHPELNPDFWDKPGYDVSDRAR